MILERFRGTSVNAEKGDKCSYTCATGGAQQSADVQVENEPVCKCGNRELSEETSVRKANSSTDTTYDDNTGCWLLWVG
jgi:hypothetical protein